MKEIKIVTYCTYKSLGSILQAYGLKKQLYDLGYSTTILMNSDENKYAVTKVSTIKSLCKFIFEIILFKKLKSAYLKRVEFIEKKVHLLYMNAYDEFIKNVQNDSCNVYIAGSDQIWQPDNCNPIFFLDFVKSKKCISYAASMGKTVIALDKQKLFQRMIKNFDYISVREDECADVIRQMTEKEVEVHIDPTFLINADEWRDISKPYNVKEPYILLYMLYWDEACKEKIKTLKKKTGLKVYAIADGLSRVYADKVLYDVGVEEFLWLIDHAEYVVTSSFHGVAFSTIFNKKYSAIINPNAPSRIENLLRKLSLPCISIEELDSTCAFNYQLTNQLINKEKARSIEYLKRVLE